MREIKFRAKLADGKIIYSDTFMALSVFFERVSAEGLEVEQYTGLKDKNGVEIYEGDILKSGDDILIVSWHNEMATFCLNKKGWVFSHFFKEGCESSESKIIGNIHEATP